MYDLVKLNRDVILRCWEWAKFTAPRQRRSVNCSLETKTFYNFYGKIGEVAGIKDCLQKGVPIKDYEKALDIKDGYDDSMKDDFKTGSGASVDWKTVVKPNHNLLIETKLLENPCDYYGLTELNNYNCSQDIFDDINKNGYIIAKVHGIQTGQYAVDSTDIVTFDLENKRIRKNELLEIGVMI